LCRNLTIVRREVWDRRNIFSTYHTPQVESFVLNNPWTFVGVFFRSSQQKRNHPKFSITGFRLARANAQTKEAETSWVRWITTAMYKAIRSSPQFLRAVHHLRTIIIWRKRSSQSTGQPTSSKSKVIDMETQKEYRVGGFHPVELGDVLNARTQFSLLSLINEIIIYFEIQDLYNI